MVPLDITDQPGILAVQMDEDANDDPDYGRQMLHPWIVAWLDRERIAYRCRAERDEATMPPETMQLGTGTCWSVLVLRTYIEFQDPDAAMAFKLRWWSAA